MTPLIIAALLGLTAALIVAYPLLGLTRERREVAGPGTLGEAADGERQARQALREVELDYTLGNLDTPDYDALRGRYERRALSALRARYQREQELDALIERQLDTLRTGASAATRAESASAATPTTPKVAPTATPKTTAARVTRRVSPRSRRAPNQKGGR